MAKRAEQKEKRRQDILKAALTIFVQKGYEAAKINDIAKKTGMSMGLMYHYFDSTELLYEELLNIALAARTGQYLTPYDDPIDYFLKSAEFIFHMAQSDLFVAELFLLINQAQHSPNIPERLKERLRKNDITEKSILMIEEGQRQGTIRKGNSAALAATFWLSVQANIENIARNPAAPCPESVWFVDMLKTAHNLEL